MNIISLAIISAALSLEFFSISQRFSYFLNKEYLKNTIIFFLILIINVIVFVSIGASIGYFIDSFFELNSFITFLILSALIALKFFFEATAKMHVKKTINPVFFQNLLGLIVPVGLNILIVSIATSLYFSMNQVFIFIVIFSLLCSFIGFFVGTFVKKLYNFRLELFSGLLILGVVIKHIVDYFLLK